MSPDHRKLKCTGIPPNACDRCRRVSATCVYSPRKQMGRPRKRRRDDAYGGEATVEGEPMARVESENLSPQIQEHRGKIEAAMIDTLPIIHEITPQWVSNDTQHINEEIPISVGLTTTLDINAALSLPSLHAGIPESSLMSCTCLSTYYLAAADLPSASVRGFPSALPPLKTAMRTAQQLLDCSFCLSDITSGKQNILLLTTLLGSIAAGFDKLLRSIDQDADRMKTTGIRMSLSMGDNSLVNAHRHTGDMDCPAKFDLDLEPDEWRVLVKRVVCREIFEDRGAPRTLQSLISDFEERQHMWHESDLVAQQYSSTDASRPSDECAVLRLAKSVRMQIAKLPV